MQGPIILPLWSMMAPDGSLQPTGTALRELPVAELKRWAREEGCMNTNTFTRPSALAPMVMSLAALAIVLGRLVLVGTARSPDEGVAAHLFQLFIVGQLPIVAFFAIRWLQRTPRRALMVLASQGLAVLVACAPVFFFQL